jgi:small-conductance mechanosensitive channel
MNDEYIVEIHSASLRMAGALASSLEKQLKEQGFSQVKKTKESPETMDLGTVLTAVVASGAATALANGIAAWLQKNLGASVTIKKNGETVIKGTNASGIALILDKLKDMP